MVVRSLASLKAENSRLLREDVARGATRFRGMPEVVTLNHTDLCNLRCIMCPRHLAQGTHRLPKRVLGYVADELFPTARKLVLTTSGGEPLVADFDFLLERSLSNELHMDVVTNGVLLTRELYREARPAIDHLNVSLDSHVPEVYETIREGSRFDRVHDNLLAIREERLARPDDVLYSTSAVVMRSNLSHLDGFVRFAASLGFGAVVLQRLLHSVKPTPHEEAETHFSDDAMRVSFERAEAAARECGVNLYRTEFGLPPVLVRPIRDKRPDLLLHQRLCWFMAQNFGVMYTGEVYPCCVPTDHCLGNVLHDDPVAIWNGPRARAIRRAQQSGRGTTFCSGCLHAPHLPARKPAALNQAARVTRRAVAHYRGRLSRRLRQKTSPIFAPPVPETITRDGGFVDRSEKTSLQLAPHLANDVATVAPDDTLWLIRDGRLHRSWSINDPPEAVATLADARAQATALRFAARDVAYVAFADAGELLRVDLRGDAPRISSAVTLSDPRAFVRQTSLAAAPDGTVVAGEYGIYPGARCGRVYAARTADRPLVEIARLDWARHIHRVFITRDGRVLITTGDLASRRRLLATRASGGRVDTIERAWSGFTAIAETDGWLHFGTDLREANGLLRRDPDLRSPAEMRTLSGALDLQVRDLVPLGGGTLCALLSMDADLPDRRVGRRAAILVSADHGATWSVVHRFTADWSDPPEAILRLPGDEPRILPVCSPSPEIVALTPATRPASVPG